MKSWRRFDPSVREFLTQDTRKENRRIRAEAIELVRQDAHRISAVILNDIDNLISFIEVGGLTTIEKFANQESIDKCYELWLNRSST